jgi:sugar lactone lactonase YvrE
LAIGPDGSLFIADTGNYRIRRVHPDGKIATFAGNGTWDHADGEANVSGFESIEGLAFDRQGNLYVADAYGRRVRKIDLQGVVTTVAGKGGFDPFFRTTESYEGDGRPALSATLLSPNAVAVDAAGNLFIADQQGNAVRRVNPEGIITTFATMPTPYRLSFDGNGQLWVSSLGTAEIRRIAPDGSSALVGRLSVSALAAEPGGGMYASAGGLIHALAHDGRTMTLAGTTNIGSEAEEVPALQARLAMNQLGGVTMGPDRSLHLVSSNRVRRLTPEGIVMTVAGGGSPGVTEDGGSATQTGLVSPAGVTLDQEGNLYIVEAPLGRIRKVSPAGVISTFFADRTRIRNPSMLAAGSDGWIYVLSPEADGQIWRLSPDGRAERLPSGAPGRLTALAADTRGNVYVASEGISGRPAQVVRRRPDGAVTPVLGDGLFLRVTALAAAGDGTIYLYAPESGLYKSTPAGGLTRILAPATAPLGRDDGPAALVNSGLIGGMAAGSDGNLYFSDTTTGRLRLLTAAGCDAGFGPHVGYTGIVHGATLSGGPIAARVNSSACSEFVWAPSRESGPG